VSIDALRESEIDTLYVLERSMRHFFVKADIGVNAGRKQAEVDEDYKQATARCSRLIGMPDCRL
jgi:hypothetical protein